MKSLVSDSRRVLTWGKSRLSSSFSNLKWASGFAPVRAPVPDFITGVEDRREVVVTVVVVLELDLDTDDFASDDDAIGELGDIGDLSLPAGLMMRMGHRFRSPMQRSKEPRFVRRGPTTAIRKTSRRAGGGDCRGAWMPACQSRRRLSSLRCALGELRWISWTHCPKTACEGWGDSVGYDWKSFEGQEVGVGVLAGLFVLWSSDTSTAPELVDAIDVPAHQAAFEATRLERELGPSAGAGELWLAFRWGRRDDPLPTGCRALCPVPWRLSPPWS